MTRSLGGYVRLFFPEVVQVSENDGLDNNKIYGNGADPVSPDRSGNTDKAAPTISSDSPNPDMHAERSALLCPKCGATKVAKSRAQGSDQLFMRFIPRRPYRCLRCYHRFWHREKFFADKRRLSSWIYVIAGLALILLLKTQFQGAPSEPSLQQAQFSQADDPPNIAPTASSGQRQANVFKRGPASPQTDNAESQLQPAVDLTDDAKRDLIENLDFSKPQSIDQRLPAVSSDELKRRLVEAKIKAQATEIASQQKLASLDSAVRVQPAEQLSLLKLDINHRIEQWRKAWEAGDGQQYLEFYAEKFIPGKSITRQLWRQQRLNRVVPGRNIQLTLSAFEVEFSNDNAQAKVTFDQLYQSNNFIENSRKELMLGKQGDQWLIVSERELAR